MIKLNTHTIYDLAVHVHPLTSIAVGEDAKMNDIFWPLVDAKLPLQWSLGNKSFFSPSLKRAAGALLRSMHAIGMPEKLPWEGGQYDPNIKIEDWQLSGLRQATTDFETVLANELPGLAIYHVSQKGIFSTDDLITQADAHIPEHIRNETDSKAKQDVCEAGKCLAFGLPTASAFHMWRALETVICQYYKALTGKTFEKANVQSNWGAYIKALVEVHAEPRITKFLDHIREEYRNPITHPQETVDLEDALNLFSTGVSAISQCVKAVISLKRAELSAAEVLPAAVQRILPSPKSVNVLPPPEESSPESPDSN
jgi:hypothetical protein